MPDLRLKTVLADEDNRKAPPGAREHLHIERMAFAVREQPDVTRRRFGTYRRESCADLCAATSVAETADQSAEFIEDSDEDGRGYVV
jgi:hypothetical protein